MKPGMNNAGGVFLLILLFEGLSCAEDSPKPSIPPVIKKFDTPIWSPDARWEISEAWGSGTSGNLDGPRSEAFIRYWELPYHSGQMLAFPQQGGPHLIWAYDVHSERIHAIAGSGRGSMDGPFSRCRFGGTGYVAYPSAALSPDARFEVRTDPYGGYAVRVLDFKEQLVRTIVPPNAGAQAVVLNAQGQAMVLLNKGQLQTFDLATGKKISELTLKATEGLSLGAGKGLALDEKHKRLYASGCITEKDGKQWHVWYFDLSDGGTFHGVLEGKRLGPNNGYAGSFDGYQGYAEQTVYFGPDDPDFRYLYMRCTDTSTFMRLDLEKRIVAACSGPAKGQKGPVMFVDQEPHNGTVSHMGAIWLPNGDFIMSGIRENPAPFFRRVK